jgi:hypothetical protein
VVSALASHIRNKRQSAPLAHHGIHGWSIWPHDMNPSRFAQYHCTLSSVPVWALACFGGWQAWRETLSRPWPVPPVAKPWGVAIGCFGF